MRHVLVRISSVVLILIALVLIALVVMLVWPGSVFAHSIAVYPQSLELVIAQGQLVSSQVLVKNNSENLVSVKVNYDSEWSFIFPPEFDVSAKGSRNIWAFFFVKQNENSPRQGAVIFLADKKSAELKVEISAPSPHISGELEARNEQLKKQIQIRGKELVKLELKKKEIEEQIKMLEVRQQEIAATTKKEEGKEERQKDLKSFLLLFAREFKNEILNDEMEVRLLKDKIMIAVPAIFIDGTKADKKGLLLLEKIGQSLSFLSGNRIEVIGHSLPLEKRQRKQFTSSWELSSLRAGLVARVFNWRAGIQGENQMRGMRRNHNLGNPERPLVRTLQPLPGLQPKGLCQAGKGGRTIVSLF